jgi:hypothetical protein
MNFSDFLDPLVIRLKTLQKDSSAVPFFDQMSGAFIWSDEKLRGLPTNEMGCLRAIFRYRTSIIVQESDPRFQSLWADLKEKYPDWIGFDPTRCSPNDDLICRYKEIRQKPVIG